MLLENDNVVRTPDKEEDKRKEVLPPMAKS